MFSLKTTQAKVYAQIFNKCHFSDMMGITDHLNSGQHTRDMNTKLVYYSYTLCKFQIILPLCSLMHVYHLKVFDLSIFWSHS